MKVDRPAGAGVRFEPGVAKSVRLVPIVGARIVRGQAGLVTRSARRAVRARRGAQARAPIAAIGELDRGHTDATRLQRTHGPTKGDLVRLADTALIAEIEHDCTTYGHELLVGAGRICGGGEGVAAHHLVAQGPRCRDQERDHRRCGDRHHQRPTSASASGRIVGIGKAGNPDVMPDVHPDMIVGHSTAPIAGGPFIVTAGAIESHAHLISPEQSDHALAGGTTTLIGNGSGPVFDVGTGAAAAFGRFLQAIEFSPLNFASVRSRRVQVPGGRGSRRRGRHVGEDPRGFWRCTPT